MSASAYTHTHGGYTMRDFISYLWWRITHRGPGLSVDEPIPYAIPATSHGFYATLKHSQLVPYGRGSEFISG